MATLAEQLTSVQSAISEIETNGQTVTDEGQTLTRADYNMLCAREQRLLNRIDRADRGRITVAET